MTIDVDDEDDYVHISRGSPLLRALQDYILR